MVKYPKLGKAVPSEVSFHQKWMEWYVLSNQNIKLQYDTEQPLWADSVFDQLVSHIESHHLV